MALLGVGCSDSAARSAVFPIDPLLRFRNGREGERSLSSLVRSTMTTRTSSVRGIGSRRRRVTLSGVVSEQFQAIDEELATWLSFAQLMRHWWSCGDRIRAAAEAGDHELEQTLRAEAAEVRARVDNLAIGPPHDANGADRATKGQ